MSGTMCDPATCPVCTAQPEFDRVVDAVDAAVGIKIRYAGELSAVCDCLSSDAATATAQCAAVATTLGVSVAPSDSFVALAQRLRARSP